VKKYSRVSAHTRKIKDREIEVRAHIRKNYAGIIRWDWSGTKPGEKMGDGIFRTGKFKSIVMDSGK